MHEPEGRLRRAHSRPHTLLGVDVALLLQLAQRLAHRVPADVELLLQLRLGRELLLHLVVPGLDLLGQCGRRAQYIGPGRAEPGRVVNSAVMA